MRLVFVGAVESSETALATLVGVGFKPALVVTLPSMRANRHSDFADIGLQAQAAGLPVHFTDNINSRETLHAIRTVEPDLCLIVGWSQICGAEFRSIPRIGSIGFHPSLLPKMRGRAVIPWTIIENLDVTGSTFFWLDDGADTGDIVSQREVKISGEETARTLYEKQKVNIAEMLPEVLSGASLQVPVRIKQEHNNATYCAKRTASDGLIDWSQTCDQTLRLIRAISEPYPGAFTYAGSEKLIVLTAKPYAKSKQYIGFPGQIQAIGHKSLVVRCADGGCIEITHWRSESGVMPKVHQRLSDEPLS
jgi:methionyl-tRNA formyltransferase